MPDLPQGQPPSGMPQGQPPQGQPPQGQPSPGGQGGEGGGIVEALTNVDMMLSKITQAASQSQTLPSEVKTAFQEALSAFRNAEQVLMKSAGGGGEGQEEPDEDDASGGATTMEQGGKGGAVPLSHQSLRGK